MNELQKMWESAYQQYIDGCKDPENPGRTPPPFILRLARHHADQVMESLVKLNQESKS